MTTTIHSATLESLLTLIMAVTPSNWQHTDKSELVTCQAFKLPDIEDVDYLSPKIKRLLQVFKQDLEVLYGDRLDSLVLYGSFARHEETEASDIDVLVVLKGNVSPVEEIWRMGDVGTKRLLEDGELISIVPTSQDDFLHCDSPLLKNIRQEGILV